MRAGDETALSEALNEAAREQMAAESGFEERLCEKDNEILRLRSALSDLTLMAMAWQTDFALLNKESPDYDPSYKPSFNKETCAAMTALGNKLT